jgi:hypothetical protein
MSTGILEPLAQGDEIRAERTRILLAVQERIDEVVDAALAKMCEEIPAYAATSPALFADVRHQVDQHYHLKLARLLDDDDVSLGDLAFARGAAMRRARAGLALEDFINAFRVGQQVFWEAVVEAAGPTTAGREAALSLATPLMRYCDFASTHAGHAFAEFHQHAVADADRARRDLLEQLMAGELPPRGPVHAAAQSYGLTCATGLLVVVAVPATPDGDADAGGAALARVALGDTRTLVVVRQGEIVAVPALGAGCDPARVCERVDAVHARLRDEGLPLVIGVSTPAAGVRELPRAYAEAHAALGWGEGVIALPRMSPFDYLTRSAHDTARRLVDPALRELLADEAACDTVRAQAAPDLQLAGAARLLQVHPNTAQYRVRRIEERTGRNPRRLADLIELLVAIKLEG